MAGFVPSVENDIQPTPSDKANISMAPTGALEGNHSSGVDNRGAHTITHVLFVLFAIVIILGLIFNSLALVTFLASTKLRKATTGLYLISLAAADNIFLFGEFLRLLNIEDVHALNFYDKSNFWCKTIFFLRYFGKLVSAWITVAITVERFTSVVYPFKVGQLSTKRNARIVICSIYICCAALTIFPLWTIGLLKYKKWIICGYLKLEEYNIWNWVVIRVGSLALPSLIIIIFTVMMVWKLCKARQSRRNLTNQSTVNSLEDQLTKMLIAVAVTFLLLRLPYTVTYYIYHFRNTIWSNVTEDTEMTLHTITRFAALPATCNYAINFFLYCLAGSTFRSQFVALICCREQDMKGRGRAGSMPHTLTTSALSLHRLSPALSRGSINMIKNEIHL